MSQETRTRHEHSDDESDNDALITQALNPDGTPRRPMNAFMIFARRRRPEITANNPPLRTGEISKVLSSEWAAMSADSKQFYLDRARKLKDNFNARWPDYVYRRRPNNSRKRKRSDVPTPSGPPVVRRCPSPGHIVPSSKPKYDDFHPVLPTLPPTAAPLTMMYLSEVERPLLANYGASLPSLLPYSRPAGTPSLASSILTSASTSPRSVSSSLHNSYILTNSPPTKMSRVSMDTPFSPYPMGYLPKSQAYDDSDTRHGDWTPPSAVRNSLALPAFSNQYAYPPVPGDDGSSSGSDFHAYSESLDYSPNSGLVPVHPHFQRS